MESVEELCDHIALINKSRKVLDGQIDEVRRTYGDNIYQLGFKGELDKLKSVLTDSYEIVGEERKSEMNLIKVKILKEEKPNELLSLLIPQVEVLHFNEIIPSMNDIFIKVVGDTNVAMNDKTVKSDE